MKETRPVIQEIKDSGVSERLACQMVGIHRASYRYQSKRRAENDLIREEILKLAKKHRRYGYRRITQLLRRAGFRVNPKRVYRIWKAENLVLPRKRPKKRFTGVSIERPYRAAHPNHVWTYDFVFDRTQTGTTLKILAIVDEFTRECLAIRVHKSFCANQVKETLERLFKERRSPRFIRSDNGPEFIQHELRTWLSENGTQTAYIEPGHPWENGVAESFIGKLRDECLNEEIFFSVMEAQLVVEQWRTEYNHVRPHSSLEYKTPAEMALSSVEPSPTAKEEKHGDDSGASGLAFGLV